MKTFVCLSFYGHNSIVKSICAYVNVISYEYETGNVDNIVWIPGKVNLTNPGTKTDSPLTQTLFQTMEICTINIDLSSSESRSAERSNG